MNSQVVVDASLFLKLFLAEADSDRAATLWAWWTAHDVQVIAPCHLIFEAISVIRNRVYRREIDAEDGQIAFTAVFAQRVKLLHPEDLYDRAWRLAQQFNRPTAYDAYYLALGEIAGCEVWTADARLYKAVRDTLKWVRALSEYIP